MIRKFSNDENSVSESSANIDFSKEKEINFEHFLDKIPFEETTAEEKKNLYMKVQTNSEKKKGRRLLNCIYASEPKHSSNSKDNKRIKIGRAFCRFINYFVSIRMEKFLKFAPVFLTTNIYGVAEIATLFDMTIQDFLGQKDLNISILDYIENNKNEYAPIIEVFGIKLYDLYSDLFLPLFENEPICLNKDDLYETACEMYIKYKSTK